jgi:hypothetical protein
MRAPRSSPVRGLFAGLIALIMFASAAIAMAAGGSAPATSSAIQASGVQAAVGGDGAAPQDGGRAHTRISGFRDDDDDADDADGGRGGRGR